MKMEPNVPVANEKIEIICCLHVWRFKLWVVQHLYPMYISLYKRIRNELEIRDWNTLHRLLLVGLYSKNRTHLIKSDDLSMMCSNSGNDNAPSSSKSASFRTLCINCFISLSDKWFWLPTNRSITCFRSLMPNISSPSKSREGNCFKKMAQNGMRCSQQTEYSKCMFSFYRSRCALAEHRHHIEKVFKCAIAIVAWTEHFTNAITEGVDA